MRPTIFILGALLSLSACSNESKNDKAAQNTIEETAEVSKASNFVGRWQNKRLKKKIVTISKKGGTYIIDTGESKLVSELKDDVLMFTNQGFSFKAFIDEDGILHIDSENYTRISE